MKQQTLAVAADQTFESYRKPTPLPEPFWVMPSTPRAGR